VAALLSRSSLFLGNDGGLLHLANALGVPSVSFYGPVDEKVYGPYGTETPHAVLTADVPCRPCYRDFRFPPCPHGRRCLEEISVEKAVEIAEKIA
jgi:ADP-heptose:LPS heptosyltransferase